MATIGFILFLLLGLIYFIYMYRYTKRKEKEGIDLATPSKAMIPGMVYIVLVVIIIVCMLWA